MFKIISSSKIDFDFNNVNDWRFDTLDLLFGALIKSIPYRVLRSRARRLLKEKNGRNELFKRVGKS